MATGLISLVVGVGGQLLSSLFKPKQKDTYTFGPRVSDLNVPTVSPGNAINRIWGTMKVNGQYIWTSHLLETMHIAAQSVPGGKGGGKGGGSTSYTISYTYSVHMAVAFARGPVAQVNRMWAGGKLLWTNPNQVAYLQTEFDAAYQSEATRLLDLGVDVDSACVSAYFFAYNNLMPASTLTMWSVNGAINYIMTHPLITDPLDPNFPTGYPTPDFWGVYGMVVQLFDPVQWDKNYVPTPIRFNSITVYNGDEFQEPDPTMQAYLGAPNVPGYRGVCYALINNLQLADFGNTVPQITAEVMNDGNITYGVQTLPFYAGMTYGGATALYGLAPAGYTAKNIGTPGTWGVTSGADTTHYVVSATPKDVRLVDIINDIILEAGLDPADYDTSTQLDGSIMVPGYAVTQSTSVRQLLQDLQKVFAFDGCGSGWNVKFKMNNGRARAIIRRQDMAAHIQEEDWPDSVEQTRACELDMPHRINFKYQEPERIYSINTVYAERQQGNSLMIEDVDMTIALHRADAQKAVENMMFERFRLRDTFKVLFPRKYILLEPGDVVLCPDKFFPGEYTAWRCMQVDVGMNGIMEMTFTNSNYDGNALSAVVGSDIDTDTPTLPAASRTYAYMLDTPILTDAIPDGAMFFTVLTGVQSGWKAGGLLVDLSDPGVAGAYGAEGVVASGGSNWAQVATGQVQVPHGFCLKGLATDAKPFCWDHKSEVIVRLQNPAYTLSNADPIDMLTQNLNVCAVGFDPQHMEILAFANAESLGNGIYRLTKLMRGLRGTEWAISSHTPGIAEPFVMLSLNSTQVVPITEALIGRQATYEALSQGEVTGDETPFKFTCTGNSLRPYAPHISDHYIDNANNFYMAWQPRNRLNGKWLNGGDIVLDQTTEAYSIDVLKQVAGVWTVQKTYDLGAVRTWSYLASAQTTDTGISGVGLRIDLYQIGATIGRGFVSTVLM